LIRGDAAPQPEELRKTMAGRLSTHVLDTSRGQPAAGMRFTLYRIENGARERVAEGATTADGRAPAPLLQGEGYRPGRYELVYHVADYFRALGVALADPPFLDEVTLAFGLGQDGHYHVPLLVSPFGYTTYRGS
jgi:5-hydroxyisourate hydrolase